MLQQQQQTAFYFLPLTVRYRDHWTHRGVWNAS